AGMLPKQLWELNAKYDDHFDAILLLGAFSTVAPLLGRPALEWLVDAGGIGLVVAWLMVSVSFLVLRKKEPNMIRPFRLKFGRAIGWAAVIMGIGVAILYMPGMPSALIWPYEWVLVGVWAVLGVLFYKITVTKESVKETDHHMKEQFSRVVDYESEDESIK